MLVLSRRPGQALHIGAGIEVHVVRVEGDRVTLGIRAPSHVTIVRSELLGEVGDEVRTAAASDRDAVARLFAKSQA